jgi:beta-lactam-binding protein with PASTA domain
VKALFRVALVALVLMMVALASAVITMSFAIHGAEVTVPPLVGLSPAEAERAVSGLGMNVAVERQYYSPDVPEGRIMTQIPTPGTRVRHGWQVRVAQSLGPQRVSIPDVLGESGRAADLNIRRRGLDVGSVAYLQIPGITADQVLAQSPPPNAIGVLVPRISLLVSATSPPQAFVMPSFIGQALGGANLALLDAGFRVGNVTVASTADTAGVSMTVAAPTSPPQPSPASIVVSQAPAPGQRVSSGATVNFEVR